MFANSIISFLSIKKVFPDLRREEASLRGIKINSCIIRKSLVVFLAETPEVSFKKSIRDIAQFGRAPALGAGGRRFKSYNSDQILRKVT